MLPQAVFGAADQLTRKIMGMLNIPWGGIDLLFAGDWLQLPPVNSAPIFAPPQDKCRYPLESASALEVWNSVNFVVILVDNMRCSGSPIFKGILDRLHMGVPTEEDVRQLHTRYIENVTSTLTQALPPILDYFAPLATSVNSTRCQYNKALTFMNSQQLSLRVFQIVATSNSIEKNNFILRHLHLDDDFTDKIPLALNFYIGK